MEGVATSDGRYVLVCGKSVFKDNTAQEAETFARVLNDALSPLLRRAELAERMAEALRGARRILSIYVTDESPALDILDANAIDGVLADWDKANGKGTREGTT